MQGNLNLPLREQILLNGEWDEGGLVPVYTGRNVNSETYSRKVLVPVSWTGKVIKAEFQGVNFIADVYINEHFITRHVGGWNPFSIDITDLVTVGEAFVLKVDVKGMQHAPIVLDGKAHWPQGLSIIGDRLCGIVDDVWLRAYGKVGIEDAFIQTSFREKSIKIEYMLKNFDVRNRVVRVEADIKKVATGEICKTLYGPVTKLNAGENKKIGIDALWLNAECWWPDDPVLYYLNSRLVEEDIIVDNETRRFGFREIWISGKHFVLNGVRVNLLGDYTVFGHEVYWPLEAYNKDKLTDTYNELKKLNIRVLRWHERPSPQYTIDMADECGLLIVCESAIEHLKEIDPEEYIKGCAQWIGPWIKANRNHPSIIMWSAENGMVCQHAMTPEQVRKFGDFIRQYDGTRPVSYDGDGDVGDVTVNYHSVRETEGNIYDWGPIVHTQKPTGISEILPVLCYFSKSNDLEMNKWRQGIMLRGARYLYFADVRPSIYTWACKEMSGERVARVKNAYAPVALFDKEYDNLGITPFVKDELPKMEGGTSINRTLILYNDEFRGTRVTVEIMVKSASKVYAVGLETFEVPLGQHVEVPYSFQAPYACVDSFVEIILTTKKEGIMKFEESRKFKLIPSNGHGLSSDKINIRIV